MGKPRLSAEARIMALYETLSPEAARIVFDLLRLKQPAKKAASKKAAKEGKQLPAHGVGDVQ